MSYKSKLLKHFTCPVNSNTSCKQFWINYSNGYYNNNYRLLLWRASSYNTQTNLILIKVTKLLLLLQIITDFQKTHYKIVKIVQRAFFLK